MHKLAIKYSLLVLFLGGLLFSFKTKESCIDDFQSTVIRVVRAFKEKDASTLNRLISKDKGLIVLYRRGILDRYDKAMSIDFDSPVPEYLPYFNLSTDYNLKFESLPAFDCNTLEWTKTGLYCDTTSLDHLLSMTARNLKKYKEDNISESEIYSFIELEKNSKRVVLSNNEGGVLIFYLTFLKNKWHFTILDRVSGDCSA